MGLAACTVIMLCIARSASATDGHAEVKKKEKEKEKRDALLESGSGGKALVVVVSRSVGVMRMGREAASA